VEDRRGGREGSPGEMRCLATLVDEFIFGHARQAGTARILRDWCRFGPGFRHLPGFRGAAGVCVQA